MFFDDKNPKFLAEGGAMQGGPMEGRGQFTRLCY